MTLKITAGLVILLIAFVLQGWLGGQGFRVDLVFPALIAFAFLFPFWEMLFLTLLGVFILNWQPEASVEIVIFALFPVAVYFSKHVLQWQPWIENMLAVLLGTIILYGAILGRSFLAAPEFFLTDLVSGLVFGTLILVSLERWAER